MSRKIICYHKGKVVHNFSLKNQSPVFAMWNYIPTDVLYIILTYCNYLCLRNYSNTCKHARRVLNGKTCATQAFWQHKIVTDGFIMFGLSNSAINCITNYTFSEYMTVCAAKYKAVRMFNILEEEFRIEMTQGEILTDEMRQELIDMRCTSRKLKGLKSKLSNEDALNLLKLKPEDRIGRLSWDIDINSRNKFTKLENKLIKTIPPILNMSATVSDHNKKSKYKISKNKCEEHDIERAMRSIGNKYSFDITIHVKPSSFDISVWLTENRNIDYGEGGPPMEHLFEAENVSQENVMLLASLLIYHFPQVEWHGRYHGIISMCFNEDVLRKNMPYVRYSNTAPFHKRLELLENYKLPGSQDI